MIRFVLTREHRYTVDTLCHGFDVPIPRCAVLAYEDLFHMEELPPATYIFADIERLSDIELCIAAEVAGTIRGAPGFRVLNDPAKVKTRYALLRALFAAGINRFDAYPADGIPRPARFPVFVRAEASHNQPLTELLYDQAALDAALAQIPAGGIPLRGLLVIEFCAEPFRGDVWRRYGAFGIGETISLDHVVSEKTWIVKYGEKGLVDEDDYRADHAQILANAFETEVRRAFEIAAIDYGRADFGLVGGRPQVYEINTNPFIRPVSEHPSPIRTASFWVAQRRFGENLFSIDGDGHGAPVRLDGMRMRNERWLVEDAAALAVGMTPPSWLQRWAAGLRRRA